ncbi:MAG TPA: DUF1731 domain-containing protein [Acidimicrobiia bacterium]|nr:DUF1731 domain-containing protein [Acidimicrobiia bacterium]
MAKIIIPGGNGYLGLSIGRELVTRGDEVVILSRRTSMDNDGIRFVEWDGRTLGDWVEELDGANAIIHLTGRRVDVRSTRRNIDDLINSRVQPVRIVGEALSQVNHPPEIWIQSSSLAIYGDGKDQLIDETFTPTGLGPREMVTVCLAWEKAFDIATQGIDRKVLLRIGIGMGGKGDPATKKIAELTKLGLGGKVGNGHQWVSWIDLRDLMRIFLNALDSKTMNGTYHATSPNPATNAEMMKTFRKVLGKKFGLPSPSLVARLGAPLLGSSGNLALVGRRCVPSRLLDEGFIFEHENFEDTVRYAISKI